MTVEKKTLLKLVAAAWGLAVAINKNRLRNQRDGAPPVLPVQPTWEAQVRHMPAAPSIRPGRPAPTQTPRTVASTSASFADSLIRQNRDNSPRMVDIYKQQTPKWWLGPGNF
jgi:hypothetical protein